MNCVVDTVRYRENIISLWHESFGDNRGYIEFFLDNCEEKLCLGYIGKNGLASMLFLLNGSVNGCSCKYIYAACTSKRFRGQGLMGGLIEYSKKICSDNNFDFIFLVPGEESLYSYYSRFGFIPKMMRSELELKGGSGTFEPKKTTDIRFAAEKRLKLLPADRFAFDLKTTEYTVAEFLHTGGEIYFADCENGYLAFAVRDNKNILIKELLPQFNKNLTNILTLFENLDAENVYIRTPIVYNSKDIGDLGTKCGMLYPISAKAKDSVNTTDMFYSGMYLD